ncbi:ATP-dependent DNA helicase RecG [Zongyangia hominis]|uniref:ATP-dependent DNA helicase RecG n=1 Tax=Zongyangia hominis TaxID=2763677 RepID=A0A926EBN6_9FIRM|nr:ATP-dependent DNA helicase RecG [Zongyangia hominis]MBC8570838.1 ATP-dependent DNA helicase RecG [Zongyangia hominis]
MADGNKDIRYLKGVGEKRAKLYEKLGITDLCSLLGHYPRTYIDLTRPVSIAGAPPDGAVPIRAAVVSKTGEQRIRKGLSLFKVVVTDHSSDMVITFFNTKFTVDALEVEQEYIFYGKVEGTFTRKTMASPLVFRSGERAGLIPVYPLTEGLSSKLIRENVRQALAEMEGHIEDPLPKEMREAFHLCHKSYAVQNIHLPPDRAAMEIARDRLIFEELLLCQLAFLRMRNRSKRLKTRPMEPYDLAPFYESLPFTLTGAQRRSIEEACRDMTAGTPMNRLVQGDVGSGKTMVAAAAVYFAARNGAQSALMAPTEILALQHFETLAPVLEPLGVKAALLTGSTRAAKRRELLKSLQAGEIQLLIGTHAIIEETVTFDRLGLVVTDEQHRFGVAQRVRLLSKGENPHVLVMSATPIPRTLAQTIYCDLDLSVIDELPPGRQKIETYCIGSDKRMRAFGFIQKHLDAGKQAYIVCPLVEAGEASDLKPATEYAKLLADRYFSGYTVGLLHGKMKPKDKEAAITRFKNGEIQLLVSTTVVEVGVDVPNAVIMMIENAERFGLSQLHQLRGRVGRGRDQAYCILLSDAKGEQTRKRLQVMCRTTDGFAIAKEDLNLRGPGDFFGLRQHGLPTLKLADLLTDTATLSRAQEAARQILTKDPDLTAPEHRLLVAGVENMMQDVD